MAKRRKDRFGLRGEAHFQMAPMIDVVFLLLIFFLCVTNFERADKIDLNLAYADMAEAYQEDPSTLIVNVTKDGAIVVLGKDPETGLVGQLAFRKEAKLKLQDFMQKLVDRLGPNFRVAIRADRDAEMKYVKDVYRAAARTGLTQISLITTKRREKGEAPPTSEEKDENLIY